MLRTEHDIESMTSDARTFAVTLVRVGPALPYFEVGAYRYTGDRLPQVGETILVSRAAAEEGEASPNLRAYVTRINPFSDTPISVVELDGSTESDDLLAEQPPAA
jgi:hypothetical protein